MNTRTIFRPRPIDIDTKLPIITDENLEEEIELDSARFTDVPSLRKKRKVEEEEVIVIPESDVPIPKFSITGDKELPNGGAKRGVKKRGRPPKKKISSGDFERPEGLIVYKEKSPSELENMVEYDLESEDEYFLEALNEKIEKENTSRGKKKKTKNGTNNNSTETLQNLSEDQFEILIDIFEKASYEAKFRQDPLFNYRYFSLSEEIPCSICNDIESEEDDKIIFCESCDVAVHQSCYGIKVYPEGHWKCEKCLNKDKSVKCVLCTEESGAFKRTTDHRWGHVICALWLHLPFGNIDRMEPIGKIRQIPAKSWNQQCALCHQRRGVCVTCSDEHCQVKFHVMCARKRGLYVELESGGDGEVMFYQYCPHHSMRAFLEQVETSHHIFGFRLLSPELLKQLDEAIRKRNRKFSVPSFPVLNLVYQFWRMKRKFHPTSLLRRFQEIEKTKRKMNEEEYYARFIKLRQQFEKLRLLMDLIRKREITKREFVRLSETETLLLLEQFKLPKKRTKKNTTKITLEVTEPEPPPVRRKPERHVSEGSRSNAHRSSSQKVNARILDDDSSSESSSSSESESSGEDYGRVRVRKRKASPKALERRKKR